MLISSFISASPSQHAFGVAQLFVTFPSPARLISSCLFSSLLLLTPLQCTQGPKGLLEATTLPTSCPQGKQADISPAVNSDPSPELSGSCGARHGPSSSGDTPAPRHTKSSSKKSKQEALHIPNPASNVPSPTSSDADQTTKSRGREGAGPAPLH